jgi:hypothetical protein
MALKGINHECTLHASPGINTTGYHRWFLLTGRDIGQSADQPALDRAETAVPKKRIPAGNPQIQCFKDGAAFLKLESISTTSFWREPLLETHLWGQ